MNFDASPHQIALSKSNSECWTGRFMLMASNCEVHIRTNDVHLAKTLILLAAREGKRIENHFSRYLENNPLSLINNSQGRPISVDTEFAQLLNYAFTLYEVSDGMFDITSGVLRKVWNFDCSNQSLQEEKNIEINAVLPLVGLQKVTWRSPILSLPPGMELDFGGIGKEYAVDRAAQLIEQHFSGSYLVNFGGDCYCRGDLEQPWKVTIEIAPTGSGDADAPVVDHVVLATGGVATSGTTKKYFWSDGKRFGHILNPKTGHPVEQAPLSVTVINESCTSAGAISTLAMLQGPAAESFLADQSLLSWIQR